MDDIISANYLNVEIVITKFNHIFERMYQRTLESQLESALFRGKVVILYGARQVGKTTLVRRILDKFEGESLFLNCDEPDVRFALEGRTSTALKQYIGKAELVVIDEAQRVQDIGLTLKLLVDRWPNTQVLATGSSSFELANRTREPLTGRKFEFHLHPLSLQELWDHHGELETQRSLDRRLIYGFYPEVVREDGAMGAEILREISGSYLYKDILMWKDIRKPEILDRLLRALALQIGSEVSLNELGQILGVDKQTVATYLDVLEQAFIVFRLLPFSRNLRNELKKSRKIYFWDVGLRNALIQNLNPIEGRTDKGALWENFVIAERIKRMQNERLAFRSFFWRTHQQKEVDYIEESEGQLQATEFKWSSVKKKTPPKAFRDAYPEASFQVVSRENWSGFLIRQGAIGNHLA